MAIMRKTKQIISASDTGLAYILRDYGLTFEGERTPGGSNMALVTEGETRSVAVFFKGEQVTGQMWFNTPERGI